VGWFLNMIRYQQLALHSQAVLRLLPTKVPTRLSSTVRVRHGRWSFASNGIFGSIAKKTGPYFFRGSGPPFYYCHYRAPLRQDHRRAESRRSRSVAMGLMFGAATAIDAFRHEIMLDLHELHRAAFSLYVVGRGIR